MFIIYLHDDAIKTLCEAINSNDGYDLSMCDRKETENYEEDTKAKGGSTITELTAHE